MKMRGSTKFILYALLALVALYFLLPFGWMVLTAFKTETEANQYPPQIFPARWLIGNFIESWQAQRFNTFLVNSLTVTVLHTAGVLLSCSMAAYGFARFSFKGRDVLFMIMLMTMMIPWDVTMIPQYMEFKIFGWINSLKASIIPGFMGSAYYIFLLRQFMMGVPKDLEEAARIDGANQFLIFTRIFLPILKPPLLLEPAKPYAAVRGALAG
jgi:multiple sugar transport system permease protein